MANWCNIRLSVLGVPDDVAAFRKDAGRLEGRIDAKKSSVFLPEMEFGEGGDLTAHEPTPFGRRFQRAEYTLQGRNDDHVNHFRAISKKYPKLAIVLTFGDPNADAHGSYLLLKGVQRLWTVSARLNRELMRKHYRRWKLIDSRGRVDYDAAESDDAEWAAFFEMMHTAAKHWDAAALKWLRARNPRSRSRSTPRVSPGGRR